MTEEHPNMALFSNLNLRDLDASAALFADDFVWGPDQAARPEAEMAI